MLHDTQRSPVKIRLAGIELAYQGFRFFGQALQLDLAAKDRDMGDAWPDQRDKSHAESQSQEADESASFYATAVQIKESKPCEYAEGKNGRDLALALCIVDARYARIFLVTSLIG
nr:hypothetical protein [uncultured Halomonas sp.]